MTDTPVALIVFLALGTVAVVLALLLVRSRQELSRSQLHSEATETELEGASRYAADLAARLQAAEAELRHLASARIPELATSLAHPNVPVPGPLGTATLSPDLDRSIDAVLAQIREEVTKERKRVDAAAQATMRGATTTIQALLYQLQTLLQRMQEKYEDPLVAEDLLAADFLNEQALRRIQSTAVVCGAWPGLTRDNSHLADVVVGASSRLSGYERVQVSNLLRDPVGVIARAVEPVAVTLTELMANALHFSHPELPVAVTLQQGNRGVSVIIDDAGVGMNAEEYTRAKRLMSGDEPVLITELGDPPRNGFAAIGQLVRQYGFSAHVEPSPYGGVRAIVHIPGDPLLTVLDEEEHPMSAMAPTPPHGPPVLPGRTDTAFTGRPQPQPTGAGASGTPGGAPEELPRRRRRSRATAGGTPGAGRGAAASAAGEPGGRTASGTGPETRKSSGPAAAVPPPSPEESAERWAAFQRGTASGRAAVGSESAGSASVGSEAAASESAGPESEGSELPSAGTALGGRGAESPTNDTGADAPAGTAGVYGRAGARTTSGTGAPGASTTGSSGTVDASTTSSAERPVASAGSSTEAGTTDGGGNPEARTTSGTGAPGASTTRSSGSPGERTTRNPESPDASERSGTGKDSGTDEHTSTGYGSGAGRRSSGTAGARGAGDARDDSDIRGAEASGDAGPDAPEGNQTE